MANSIYEHWLVIRVVDVYQDDIDGLVQKKRNSIASALELRLSCTNPSTCSQNETVASIRDCSLYMIIIESPIFHMYTDKIPYYHLLELQ